jgi:starch-binding outer membrane protein, SusD/RagB family
MKQLLSYTLLLFLVISATSCKKWMDLKPQDGIVREAFWQTKEQVNAAVTGIYASLLTHTTFNGNPVAHTTAPVELFFLWGEARTDMVAPGFAASADENDFVNMNIQPNNRYTNWRVLYQTINYCNTVIELAPGVLQKDNTFTEAALNRAVAEAKTIRALMYFYLARTFRDVPLKLDATISDENIKPIAKSPADTVLAQVIKDLIEAEPHLPLTYGNAAWDKGRVTRFTANVLLADVYLWTEKYAECRTECDKIINSGRFGLVGGNQSLLHQLYYDGNSTESIFELQFDVQKLNPFYFMHHPASRRWVAAPHLMEQVFGVDVVNAIPLEDRRGNGVSLRSSDFTIWKYIGATQTTMRSADQSYAHWIFYRYADVLLMKAEAINQLDQPLEASRLVKTIRERAEAFDFNSTMDSTSKSGMEEYILQERQREFAFEGKRWYDVLRNAKRNNYQNMRYLLDMTATSIPADRQQAAFNKVRDHNSHYLPIFLYEMQTNRLLVQNPFYK